MENPAIEEDSIDLEALQAQIDISMSFAQDMISSWIKPSRKLPSKNSRDTEAELKEYMRRPPRLGVGTAIPESYNSSRDTARLKGQLLGNGMKRSKEEELNIKDKSDEEESRAGAIKKRSRVDPFGDNGKKKRKKQSMIVDRASMSPSKPLDLPQMEWKEEHEVLSIIMAEDMSQPSIPVTTPKRKKRKGSHSTAEHYNESTLVKEPTHKSPQDGAIITTNKTAATSPVTYHKISLTSMPATPLNQRRQIQSAALLKQPLLNLVPPENGDESEDDTDSKTETPADAPKKKRKRKRRKKKKGVANGSADGSYIDGVAVS